MEPDNADIIYQVCAMYIAAQNFAAVPELASRGLAMMCNRETIIQLLKWKIMSEFKLATDAELSRLQQVLCAPIPTP